MPDGARIPGVEEDPFGADAERDGGVYRTAVDPVTGQEYTYFERDTAAARRDGGVGPRGGIRAERRAERQNRKDERNARTSAQRRHFEQRQYETMGGILGEYEGLEYELPDELDLLGGQEWADSQFADGSPDPGAEAAQRAALQQLGQISQGGYTGEEAAAMQRIRRETAQQEQAQREAIQQQMAMRGMAGSGAELGAALGAQQGAANRASTESLETQAAAQRRALQALGMQGQLGGQMRGQAGDEASAVDDFTRWNLERRGGAAQQRYQNRFGLAQERSGAQRATHDAATGQRAQTEEQRRYQNERAVNTTTQILGSVF